MVSLPTIFCLFETTDGAGNPVLRRLYGCKLVEPIKLTAAGSRVFPIVLSVGQSLIGYRYGGHLLFLPIMVSLAGIGLILFTGMLTVAVSGLGEYG